MKTPFIPLLGAFATLMLPLMAAEPSVSLSVKKQVVDSDHELGGRQGSRAKKVIKLRVEVTNTGASVVSGAQVSGIALIKRERAVQEKVTREKLAPVALPELKPNARETVDLGNIELHELETRLKKLEQTLEEWKVVCLKDGVELGSAVSGPGFEILDRDAAAASAPKGKQGKRKKN